MQTRALAGACLALFVAASSDAAAAPFDPAAVAGVYKHRFRNGDVQGETFTSEDILEIVRLSPTTAYFKAHLEFYNGHQCSISGVADVVDDALVYIDRSDDATIVPGKRCSLTLRVSATKIAFEDPDLSCKAIYCGMRGGFIGDGFDRTTRRTIRYMKLLQDSADFHRAVEEHARPDPRTPATP